MSDDLEANPPPKDHAEPGKLGIQERSIPSKKLDVEKLRRMEYERKPMTAWERKKLVLSKWRGKKNGKTDDERSSQIYVPPYDEHTGFIYGMYHALHLKFHDLIVWMTNTTYSIFFVYVLAWYIILINIFALILYGAIIAIYDGKADECITSFEFEPDDVKLDFAQNMEWAFELSWTTFSTVGYGAISPSGGNSGCYWVRYICAIEAAAGIIYFGFSGAVFFAKIQRILARAPVTFSSSLCVQFSEQHRQEEGALPKRGLSASTTPMGSMIVSQVERSPYPIIEFRIVNDKANAKGWEILQAELNCMVSIDVPASVETKMGGSICNSKSELFTLDLGADEGRNAETPIARQSFHKLNLVAEKHPYFKRVWYCRHILDENSPLVSDDVREEMQEQQCWPTSKLNASGIRSSLVHFNTIIITMTGTLNTTSNGVFIEKRYKYGDICVGYRFASMLFLSDCKKAAGEKKLNTDLALIHDIVPQGDGSAEPLDGSVSRGLLARKSPSYGKSTMKLMD